MTPKKRGAPRGNRNAWKHGFYSSAFKEHERHMLSQVPAGDLSSEIELIRIANYRFMEALAANHAPLDVNTQLAALRALNLSAQSITSLIRAQALTVALAGNEKLADLIESLQSPVPNAEIEASQPDKAGELAEGGIQPPLRTPRQAAEGNEPSPPFVPPCPAEQNPEQK